MLRFFRQIRKKLMEQNKTRTYLLYAVGEIALVMIGILLALQVNNWNQKQQLIEQEQEVISALYEEIDTNATILGLCMEYIKRKIAVIDSMQNYVGPTYANLPDNTLHRWLATVGGIERCAVETDAIDELRSSGSLNLISNRSLRRDLSKWNTAIITMKSEESDWSQEFSSILVPYLNKWILWADVDYLAFKDDPNFSPSAFEIDENLMLQEYQFDNHLNNTRWRWARIKDRTDSLSVIGDSLHITLKEELN